jgi:hypothetical protein
MRGRRVTWSWQVWDEATGRGLGNGGVGRREAGRQVHHETCVLLTAALEFPAWGPRSDLVVPHAQRPRAAHAGAPRKVLAVPAAGVPKAAGVGVGLRRCRNAVVPPKGGSPAAGCEKKRGVECGNRC